jgi:glutathione synthase/RimK-type ligase-like ATP-grasp enzyme
VARHSRLQKRATVILICGIGSESPVRGAIDAAERTRVPHVVLDQRNSDAYEISVDWLGGRPTGVLSVDGEAFSLESFSGIYARLLESDLLPENRRGVSNERRAHAWTLQHAFEEWLEVTDSRVANRTSSMASNVSKPYQAQLIRNSGLATPLTLVTNRPDEVRDFNASKAAVFKSVSSVRSIVQPLTRERTAQLDRVDQLPTQFQERIAGVDVRVHVVGTRVLATEISSEAVDYRYASRAGLDVEMVPTNIPSSVEKRCKELAVTLKLEFCGIDLKRTPDGSYVCFEVNPSPAYNYYEEATGQPISDALVEYLERG